MKRVPKSGGGLGAITSATRETLRMGLLRGPRTMLRVNQPDGFACPGCAWPEPPEHDAFEFCENGTKHIAHEATRKRVGPEFFARWTIPALLAQPDQWLEAQGRLTHPMIRRAGSDCYEPIGWDEALARIGERLRGLGSPDEAIFYTSGRTSNEAAFLYQLFVRLYGTNNLPDCSNMCHESSGTGLTEVIGAGKGTVGMDDFARADLILILGQNPGSNHPRMFTLLEAARRGGCRIVSVNPLREVSLVRFAHPKHPIDMLTGGAPISDLFLQVRIGGDVALLQGIAKEVLLAEDRAPGTVLDADFIRTHTEGYEAYLAHLDALRFEDLVEASGVSREEMGAAAAEYVRAERVIACWAMGLTQHRHAVANVQEIVNLMLLRGNLGRPGAGVCPVRGHSNVQGDRTMGIWESPTPAFLDLLGKEFAFDPPSKHGVDTVGAIEAMRAGSASVFFALGGNFLVASPDTEVTGAALSRCRLTAHVATTLNRSHLITGEEALLLPCLGRTERDVQKSGPQFVTVEDSMSAVHRSQGHLTPASAELRSEPAIVAGLARATLGDRGGVDWEGLVEDYDRIRDRIARVIPGFDNFNRRAREPGGFVLPSGPRAREFATPSGKARFTAHATPRIRLEPGQFLLMTIRSHDQFNTTVYSQDDRYRGISGDRRVVFLRDDDLEGAGLHADDRVDLTSHVNGESRVARGFRVVPYDLPRRCAAAYFPEANALVPISSFAEKSRTPAYKSIPIRLRPSSP